MSRTTRDILAVLLLGIAGAALIAAKPPAADQIQWAAVGTTTQPAGQPLTLTPERRATLAAWLTPPANPWTRTTTARRLTADWPSAGRLWIDGQPFNLAAESIARPVTITECLLTNAAGADLFAGQGFYADRLPDLKISGLYSAGNGWKADNPTSRNGYRHGLYVNFGVDRLTIEDSWIDANAAAGIQTRARTATIRRCLITRNAYGILAVGPVTIESSTIYDGGRHYIPPSPGKTAAAWQGNAGLSAFSPVTCRDVWIVGHPAQAKPTAAGVANYDLGPVVCSSSYPKPEWKRPTDAQGRPLRELITAADCRIVGFPPAYDGRTFAGDIATAGAGWTVSGQPVDAWAELERIRADLLAGRLTVAEAAAQGQAAVRSAAR